MVELLSLGLNSFGADSDKCRPAALTAFEVSMLANTKARAFPRGARFQHAIFPCSASPVDRSAGAALHRAAAVKVALRAG